MAHKRNPAKALAKPAAGFWNVNLRAADDIQTNTTIAQRREAHLIRRCGVRPVLASVVAGLAYGEAR